MYPSNVLNNWLCVNLSRLWDFFFPSVVMGCCWISAMNWSSRCLHCFKLCVLIAGTTPFLPLSLLETLKKMLSKKRYHYFYSLTLLHFMLGLLPVILCLMYDSCSIPKIQSIRRGPESHSLLFRIYQVSDPSQIYLKGLRIWIGCFGFALGLVCCSVCVCLILRKAVLFLPLQFLFKYRFRISFFW